MRGNRIATAVFAALVCASLFAPAFAAAGVKTIWPGDLIPGRADSMHQQAQFKLSMQQNQAPGYFYAPIKLPVGAVVTKVEIFYYGTDANADMYVTLKRKKFAAGSLNELFEDMVQFHPVGNTFSLVASDSSTSIQAARIPRDYGCFLSVDIMDDGSQFFGAKIFYRK